MDDSYYQKILKGLACLDRPYEFEHCVVDLLREGYPGLVPIPGGQDAGMDGAIADGEGEAFPLITTTAKDVIGNLTRNLRSYRDHGGNRNRAVVATSQALTPRRRRNLEKRAREFNVELVGIHAQRDLANRLHCNSRWTRKLLGISGRPPALSEVPAMRFPFVEIELVGRQTDLRWVVQTNGDRLVVGQPGSGKTYLLLQLVRDGKALFLASKNETAIADAARELKPEIVIVDDAHGDLENLERLCQIRQKIGAEFSVIATTWPGAEDDVASALGIAHDRSRIHHLELLTRSEIIEVLTRVGVDLPKHDPFLHMLVDQASNKPGLAVLLGSLSLRGEFEEILSGRALRRSLIPNLRRILGHDPSRLLACFAIGGDRGLAQEPVRSFLGLSVDEFQDRLLTTSQGGVLSVRSPSRLVVEPDSLRLAVLDRVFFQEPKLDYKELLEATPDRLPALETLIRAAKLHVPVPVSHLQELLLGIGERPSRPWRTFALLGSREADWVMEHYPGPIEAVAPSVLYILPRKAIRRLLAVATDAEGTDYSSPPHPLRILKAWLAEIPHRLQYQDPQGESLRRRTVVVEEALRYLRGSGDYTVALKAMLQALSPRLEQSLDSATKDSVVFEHGVLPPNCVRTMQRLWQMVRPALLDQSPQRITREVWSLVENVVHEWTYPDSLRMEDKRAACRTLAKQIVTDLTPVASDHPGLGIVLEMWASRLQLPLQLEIDPYFRVLFPPDSSTPTVDFEAARAQQEEKARRLAKRWATESAVEVASRLAFFEREARQYLGDRLGFQTRNQFYRTLADTVSSPDAWLKALLDQRLDGRWLGVFLDRALNEAGSHPDLLTLCLEDTDYFWLGARAALQSEEISEELIEAVLSNASESLLESIATGGGLPLRVLRRLLEHPSESVVAAAVAGEWTADPRGEVRQKVTEDWRNAVMRIGRKQHPDEVVTPPSSYWLKCVFAASPELSLVWLKERLVDGVLTGFVRQNGNIAAAVSALDLQGRQQLLGCRGVGLPSGRVIALLVQDSVELYSCLLQQGHLKHSHLVPLEGKAPDEKWVRLATVALESGCTPSEVASASFSIPPFGMTIAGSGLQHWSRWLNGFEALQKNSDGELGEVADHGVRLAEQKVEEAEEKERHRKIHGVFR